jgi:hypothetical protein
VLGRIYLPQYFHEVVDTSHAIILDEEIYLSHHLLQQAANPTCYACPLKSPKTALCGALVTVPGVAPYLNGNATSYCKYVRASRRRVMALA